MNGKERRLMEVEEFLRRSLERKEESANKEVLHSLITDPVFIRAMQEAEENTIAKRPKEDQPATAEEAVQDPEFNQELQRILKRIDGEK